ncbi:hypothetical protein EDB85DRAFT_2027156, partial [Lactarius pseudohatsudake]
GLANQQQAAGTAGTGVAEVEETGCHEKQQPPPPPQWLVGTLARARAPGGWERDAVEERTGVATDEESAGEEGVATAATPGPDSAQGTCAAAGGASSFSAFAGTGAAGAAGLPRPTRTRPWSSLAACTSGATMDAIGLTDLTTSLSPLWATALACEALPVALIACAACVGALAPLALVASAQINATAVTRPPRLPRADSTSYFIST